MAAIDKTYVDADQLREAIEWCNKMGMCELENGYKFRPINFVYGYNDLDDPNFDWNREEYVLWNTPKWFDRWLWLNCPLSFVKETLKWQYGEDTLKKFEEWKYYDNKNSFDYGKQHYTFLKSPKWRTCKWWMSHGRRNNPWPGKCQQQTYFIEIKAPNNEWRNNLGYCKQTDTWELESGFLPHGYGDDYVWQHYHKNIPNKKSIIRELRRWYIPKGYIVRVYQLKWNGLDFEILVK